MARLLLFLLLISCASPPPPHALKIAFNTQPTTLDPRKAGDFVSSTVICMVYEGLTRALPGGEVEPALAESVEVSSDKTVYTFHLRDAFWSDGSPITAYDFESSWKQTIFPPTLCTYLFYPIKNAREYAKKGESVGIYAIDAKTLRVELEQPTPYFYSLTAFPSFLPFKKEGVFSGPFRIAKKVHQSEMRLVKNDRFWRPESFHIDEVHISIIPDEMTALEMFEQGLLDWVGGSLSPIPLDAIERLENKLVFIPAAASTFCTFNTKTFPFQNLSLRRAFSYAINRKEIAQNLIHAKEAVSILPPAFSEQSYLLSSTEKAKEALQIALKELGPLDEITLYYKPGGTEKRLAQTLQKQWEEALGITVQLVQLDFKSHAQKLQQRDYQIALATWIAQFDDPLSLLERFADRSNLKNYPGWESAEYADLLSQAASSQERAKFLQRAEDVLAKELPLAPIYHWNSPALFGPRILTFGWTPCGGVLFERFHLRSN